MSSLKYIGLFGMYGDQIFPFQGIRVFVGTRRKVRDRDPAWRGEKIAVKGSKMMIIPMNLLSS